MLDRKVLRQESDGELVEHADLSEIATFHANDMVVDRQGRAYVGNFGYDLHSGAEARNADLALVHPDGRVEVAATGLNFPNGSVITPDGSTLIVGETMALRYRAWDIGADGTLGNERVWAQMQDILPPDGCALDAEGGIWFAAPSGPECVRVVEGGEVTHRVTASQNCFACMLGGDDGRTLFVFTAPDSHPDQVAGQALGKLETVTVGHPHAGLP